MINDEWTRHDNPRPCTNDPELWFSTRSEDKRKAREFCAGCPLLQPCRDYALATRPTHGMWGGLTAKTLRPGAVPVTPRRDSKTPVDCDSPTSYAQHRRRGEVCEPCQAKRAAQVESSRRARLEREHTLHGGSMTGYNAHVALGEQPCLLCRAVNARRLAARRAALRSPQTGRSRADAA